MVYYSSVMKKQKIKPKKTIKKTKRRKKKMEIQANEVEINGKKYVAKDSISVPVSKDGKDYVICRTRSAGVFAGYLKSREGQEVILLNARRLWYWSGAASLSQLANEGVNKPSECKFPCEVDKVTLLDAIEIIPATEKCKKSIDGVKTWSA